MNLNLLYSLGRPVEESDKLLNKYTFLAYKYNYPYTIFNNRNLWSYYKKNGNNMDSSISSFNLQVLKSLTNNVLLCFDNDNAGKEAYIKESKKLRYNGISVRKIIHVDNVKDIGDILEMEKNGFSDNEITYYKNNYLNQIIFEKSEFVIY